MTGTGTGTDIGPGPGTGALREGLDGWLPLTAEVLGLPVDDLAARWRGESFIALGGTSLQAIGLTAGGQRLLAEDVEVARLLSPLPLADALAEARAFVRTAPAAGTRAAGPVRRDLLPGQKAMLAAHLAGRDQSYRLMFTARPPHPVSVERTRAALEHLTARHESLRTVFVGGRQGAHRLVLPPGHPPRLLHQSLPAGGDPVRAVHELYSRRAARLLQPFEQPPVVFVRTAAGDETLVTVLIHHALIDGWGIGVLWREFAALCEDAADAPGATQAPDGPVAEGPSPEWTGTRLAAQEASGVLDAATARLRDRLDAAPLVAALPTDRERGEEADGSGERLVFTLPPEIAEGVDRLARRCRSTVTSVLLSAWALTVCRRAGVDDLVLGVAAAGRSEAGMESLIGLCTRIIPVRCRIGPGLRIEEHVRATADALAQALADADLPFARVVQALGGEVDASRNPVAQIGFAAHHELVPDAIETPGGTWRVHEGHCHGSTFDALLFVQAWSAEPRLALEYATSAQTPADAGELAESFQAVLRELAAPAEPDAQLDRVSGLSEGQRRRLADLGTGEPYDTDDDLWSRFEEHACQKPGAVALVDEGADVTLAYGQLRRHALAYAEVLRAAGVGAGDRVVLEIPRSAAEAIVVLAVARLRATYVAVDPSATAEWRARIAETVAPAARIGALAHDPAFTGVPVCPPPDPRTAPPGTGTGTITAEADAPAVPAVPAAPTAPEPASALYVSFTSGTTGVPKGVVVPHRAVLRLADDTRMFADQEGMRFLRLSPLAFDASTLELLVPLADGSTVVVHPPHEPTPNGLAAFLDSARVTHAWLTAGLFHLVADHRPDAFSTLRQVFTGGGVVSGVHVRRVLEACPGLRVTNGYGPTENTTFTTVCHAESVFGLDDPFPIGVPVRGTRLRIVDAAGRPVPPGAVGELRAAGTGLADGYLGDPERTAAAFVEPGGVSGGRETDSGETDCGGAREYRTGDLVRWAADGRLCFLGRADRQVKIAGHRVELVAVERRIKEQAGVRDAVVFLAGERLCAAVKADDGVLASAAAALEQTLAAYERPQRWLAVTEFPLDRNGKVDLRALAALADGPPAAAPLASLAAPTAAPAVPAAAPAAPSAVDFEELISEIWAEVLDSDDFGPDEGFFDVGGDSLAVAVVRRRLRERLGGRPISLTDLYRFPTVQALARHLQTDPAETAEKAEARG